MAQATRRKRPTSELLAQLWGGMREVSLWVSVVLAVYLLVALVTHSPNDPGWSYSTAPQQVSNAGGVVGAYIADILLHLLGWLAYLLPAALVYAGWLINRERREHDRDSARPSRQLLLMRSVGSIMLLLSGTGLLAMHGGGDGAAFAPGGILGTSFDQLLIGWFNRFGAGLMLLGLFVGGVTLLTGLSWLWVMDTTGAMTLRLLAWASGRLTPHVDGLRERVVERRQRVPDGEDDGSSRASAPQPDPELYPLPSYPQAAGRTVAGASSPPGVVKSAAPGDPAPPMAPASAGPAMALPTLRDPAGSVPVAQGGSPQPAALQATAVAPPCAISAPVSAPAAAPVSAALLPGGEAPEPTPIRSGVARHEPVLTFPEQAPPPDEGEPVFGSIDELGLPPLTATEPELSGDAGLPPISVAVDVQGPLAAVPPPPPPPPVAGTLVTAPEMSQQPALAAAAPALVTRSAAPPPPPTAALQTGAGAGATIIPPYDPQAAQAPARSPRPPGTLPPLDLLDPGEDNGPAYTRETLDHLSALVEEKLGDFGVQVQVVAVHPGPVITRFEVQPAPGLKVSRITNLSKDLARSLSVTRVRVVEVIPGKSTIGLEIPNHERQTVRLSEVLSSRRYDHSRSPLSLALGKDIGGKPVVVDLAKMPHLLVAGTTGSGKSVAVNAMILSMLYKAQPDQVRLIMVDPKMLELSIYDGIPHLLAPVVTDMKEAAHALRWCVVEMERRYHLMAAMGVRNIAGFNRKVAAAIAHGQPIPDPLQPELDGFPPATLEPLPYIVVIVDELADLMMVVGKKIEELIARLAQKARAAGLHLILATQRPSVDVITGLIKANIPTRIAFQVSSKVDSRTILDQGGAEALLGMGDMLYLAPGTGIPTRVHGAFVDDHEVHNVVEDLKLYGEPDYHDEILEEGGVEAPDGVIVPGDPVTPAEDADPLYDQAVRIVTETRRASISGVQRRLKIGYNRAARLVESMEAAGVVGTQQSNGNREVLAPPPVAG